MPYFAENRSSPPMRRLVHLLALATAALAPTLAAAQVTPALYRTLVSPFDVANGRFGGAIVNLGDVDADGTPDLAVGAIGPSDEGVYVVSGATGASLYRVWATPFCSKGRCNFGRTIAAVPDTDGDGVPDFAVGASGQRVGGRNYAGAVYLFSGATGAPRWRRDNPSPTEFGDGFGRAVASAGDVDGDGIGDVIGGSGSGDRFHIVSGASGAVVRSETGTGTLALTSVGDTNGDGDPEVAVATATDPSYTEEIILLYDAAAGVYRDTVAAPTEAIGSFGLAVAPAGDVDGDSAADFAVGARNAGGTTPINGPGRAYVYSGATGALVHALQSPQTSPFGGAFGWSVAAGTDVDGDGVGDVAVGAIGEDGTASSDGQVHVFSGATGALLHTLVNPDTPQNNAQFGYSVAFTRTADDRPALAVGTPDVGEVLGSPPGAGRVYVFAFGDSTVGTSPGPPSGDELAVSVWPNPSAGAAAVTVSVGIPASVRVVVVDALGRTVAVVHDGPLAAGRHRLALPASLAPGIYAVRVSSAVTEAIARLTVARRR